MPSVPCILLVPAACKPIVSIAPSLDHSASATTYLEAGSSGQTAPELHHGSADFVAHTGLTPLRSGSASGCCSVTCRVSAAGPSSASGAGVVTAVVGIVNLLLGRCRGMAAGNGVGRVLGRRCNGTSFATTLQA